MIGPAGTVGLHVTSTKEAAVGRGPQGRALRCLTHWRPIPIHYRDQSFLHCRPIPIVYRDQFNIFFLFRTIPDTVSGLGFSVCYLLLSFHSKFRLGGVHSFYFTQLLRNPTQLDKLFLTISKWQRIEANCWGISVKI